MSLIETISQMPFLQKIAFSNMAILCCVQFFYFPIVALRIKREFTKYNISMDSNPYLSFTNRTRFWKETKSINADLSDEKVKRLLQLRKAFWVYMILSFIFWGFAVFYTVRTASL